MSASNSTSNSTWIILGATSSMARALARALAEQGHSLLLAGRDMEDLRRQAADCTARGAPMAEIPGNNPPSGPFLL